MRRYTEACATASFDTLALYTPKLLKAVRIDEINVKRISTCSAVSGEKKGVVALLKNESASAATPIRRQHLSRARVAARQNNLLYYGSMLCVFFSSVAETMGVSISIPYIVTILRTLIGFGMCVLLMNQKEVQLGLQRNPCVMVLPVYGVYLVLATCSSFVTNEDYLYINSVSLNILHQLLVLNTILLVLYSLATGRAMDMFDCLYYFMVVLAVINDLQKLSGVYYTDGSFETYLVGTKFDVCYLHMTIMALFFTRLKLKRRGKKNVRLPGIILLLFLMLNIIISKQVDCNTGILGSLLLAISIYISDHYNSLYRKCLCSTKFFVTVIVLSTTFVSYIFWILEQPIVQYIIVDVFERSLTLTGRTDIYRLFPSAMNEHWMWGYGLGTAYPVSWELFGYTDVQNSVLQWVLQIGVPASIAMIILFCFIVSYCQKMESPHHVMPLLALIYVYLLLGTVEITINYNFWLFMLMLLLLAGAEVPPMDRRLQASSRQPIRSIRKGDAKGKYEN